jgi:hypothetical protein
MCCGYFSRTALSRVMTRIKISNFTNADVLFLKEYAQVMSHVAISLDMLQGEEQAYLGCLLPTLAVTTMNLEKVLSMPLAFCKPLVQTLLDGIHKRFDSLFEDKECQLAAAFHPRFRLLWIREATLAKRVKQSMENVVEAGLREAVEEQSASSSDTSSEDVTQPGQLDDFYGALTKTPKPCSSRHTYKTNAIRIVGNWLASRPLNDLTYGTFPGEPVLSKLFIKYNTAVPSSAAVERFFSQGKDILRAKRSSLSDKNFELLMFMRGNRHHLKSISDLS